MNLQTAVEWIAAQRLNFHQTALLLEALERATEHQQTDDVAFHLEHARLEAEWHHEHQHDNSESLWPQQRSA